MERDETATILSHLVSGNVSLMGGHSAWHVIVSKLVGPADMFASRVPFSIIDNNRKMHDNLHLSIL